jgi:hypothetical protein
MPRYFSAMLSRSRVVLHYLVGCAFILISGCANLSTVDPLISPSAQNPGRVLISFTHPSSTVGIRSAKFAFSRVGRPYAVEYVLSYVRGNRDTDRIAIDQDGVLGEVAVLELPEGDYAADKWSVSLSSGVDFFGPIEMTSDKTGEPVKISFTVRRGQITYLGNVHLSVHTRSTVRYEVKDMRTRDVPLVLKKLQNVSADQIDYRTMIQSDPK